jgi:cysteine desulfurase/selenocysteine lyase
MIENVTFVKTTFNKLPFKFEAGTPDFVGTAALATALNYINSIGLDNIAHHEDELLKYATEKILQIPGMRIIGTAKEKCSVISFLVDDIHPYDIGTLLDKMGIAVRTGHHCAEPLMHVMGVEGTIRASFAFYNTKEEIDILIKGLERIIKMF